KILSENREKLEQLAELLLDREVIFREDLENIFGKRPWDKEEEALPVSLPATAATDNTPEQTQS
ncbi:MAG TPA: hypothetical protein PKG48_08015, partial [Bacteroidales bacterium]|nr:hypothetical protein [Bacteroidales bacterium]